MKRGLIIAFAAAALAVPATGSALPPTPLPPVMPPQIAQLYMLHGALTNYVPAANGNPGSVTIRVFAASGNAGFAIGSTITIRTTASTFVGGTLNQPRTIGWIRIASALNVHSTLALQALPAASIMADRPEMTRD